MLGIIGKWCDGEQDFEIKARNDQLVFEGPLDPDDSSKMVFYGSHVVKVNTAHYGLPQVRNRVGIAAAARRFTHLFALPQARLCPARAALARRRAADGGPLTVGC